MNYKPIAVIVIVWGLFCTGHAYAGGAVWLGNLDPLDNNWTTGTNWEHGLPTSADPAYITYNWTNGINGPVINAGDGATADLVFLGWGGWGEGITTMYINGGSLDTREWWIGKDDGQSEPEAPGVLEITDGIFTNTGHLIISCGADGTVNQTGGCVTTETLVLDWQTTSNPEYGVYKLHGGTLDIGSGGLHVRPHGSIDIEEGVMTVLGDINATIAGYIVSGQLTGYGGSGIVLHDYNITNPGKTTVWAEVSEPTNKELYSDTWVATDALNRELPGYAQCGPQRSDKYIGIFYWTWHVPRPGPYDVTTLIQIWPPAPAWGSVGAAHHWGEPELGYYRMTDPYVIRKHASMLSDAGVDVIIFDTTNSPFTWYNEYMALCSVYTQIRSEGGSTPQIAFLAPFWNPVEVVETVYNDLYEPGLYQPLWFMWDGKPLIMADPGYFTSDPAIYNFFTFRKPVASYFTGPSGSNQWGWLEIYPQHTFYDSGGSDEQVTVGVAQNAILDYNGAAPMSHKDGAMGRSWHNGAKDTMPNSEYYGLNFQEQWDRALSIDPEFIFITGWNEWVAGRFLEWSIFTAAADSYYSDAMFIDQYNHEYSRDTEPMLGGHTDSYYYQMIDNIRRFKGVSQTPASSSAKTIIVNGDFSDWDDVAPEFRDTIGDTAHRSFDGYGSTYYTNSTGRNDLTAAKVACNERYVYFYVETADDLTSYTNNNWMFLFIDADRNKTTGWEGYDYLVNSDVLNSTTTTLKQSTAGWNWTTVCQLSYKVNANKLEIRIPRSSIGQTGQTNIDFDFHWADNIQNNDDIIEFSVSGDSAPNRRFDYRYENDVYAWLFEQDGNAEGWYSANNMVLSVAGDVLTGDITGSDPHMHSADITVDSGFHQLLYLKMKNSTAGTAASLYWITDNDGAWDENKSVQFAITSNDNCFKDYWIDLSGNPVWTDTITKLRIDPSDAATGQVDIDMIALTAARTLTGDSDLDGCVDMVDLAEQTNRWLQIDVNNDCDYNDDCDVDFADFAILAANWLKCLQN